jgi:hypothetical protein
MGAVVLVAAVTGLNVLNGRERVTVAPVDAGA